MKTWQGMAAAGLLLAGGGAQAALVPYTSDGVDLVYDNDYTPVGASSPGLTWMADANLAASETFGVSGINPSGFMTWDTAQAWIAAMNAANYAGANDWRLWSALNSDGSGPCGRAPNCNDSELGHLFYVEGGLSSFDAINDSADLTAVFTNMQDSVYRSGTEYAPNPDYAWLFRTDNGIQYNDVKDFQYYGWAVRPGQIAAAPLPGTAALMALGLAGLGARRLSRRPIHSKG
ncbi:MAG: hypothetical protein GVY09_20490 [Gammaproteobacteria bacterium]|jgi:hypothetical protein|nr:hypothetical protein [Gammaproteobacteria bacterium]